MNEGNIYFSIAADFGLSKIIGAEVTTNTVCGTPGYCGRYCVVYIKCIIMCLVNAVINNNRFLVDLLNCFLKSTRKPLSKSQMDVFPIHYGSNTKVCIVFQQELSTPCTRSCDLALTCFSRQLRILKRN